MTTNPDLPALRDALAVLGKGEVFDEIYHLAAAVGVKLVVEDPARAIEVNVEQTAALLRTTPAGLPLQAILHAASTAPRRHFARHGLPAGSLAGRGARRTRRAPARRGATR